METMIKCFHKAADSKFDDAYTRILISISDTNSSQYQPRYSCLILKVYRSLDTFFLFLGEIICRTSINRKGS